jgi:hypothetical protein
LAPFAIFYWKSELLSKLLAFWRYRTVGWPVNFWSGDFFFFFFFLKVVGVITPTVVTPA